MATKALVKKGNTPPPPNGGAPAPDPRELWRMILATLALLYKIGLHRLSLPLTFRIWHVPLALLIFFAIFQFRQPPSPVVVQYITPATEVETKNLPELPPVVGKPAKTENEAEPVHVAAASADPAVREYIKRFARIAQLEQKKFGIPASISLAQGLVESRAGTSKLARTANNHFGIKCFSKKCGRGHCLNYHDDHAKDFFRKFSSAWESWRAHSKVLSEGRYKKLHQYGLDYRKWAQGLERVGYATDRQYAEKLIGVIETNELHKYDR